MTVAPPSALPPAAPALRHRLRARRAAARGVTVHGVPLIGRNVTFDVTDGGRLVLGDGCVVMDGCRFHVRGGTVTVGDGAVLGERCAIICHERIEIGTGAVVADGTPLIDAAHDHRDPERPVRHQPLRTCPIAVAAGARVGRPG